MCSTLIIIPLVSPSLASVCSPLPQVAGVSPSRQDPSQHGQNCECAAARQPNPAACTWSARCLWRDLANIQIAFSLKRAAAFAYTFGSTQRKLMFKEVQRSWFMEHGALAAVSDYRIDASCVICCNQTPRTCHSPPKLTRTKECSRVAQVYRSVIGTTVGAGIFVCQSQDMKKGDLPLTMTPRCFTLFLGQGNW